MRVLLIAASLIAASGASAQGPARVPAAPGALPATGSDQAPNARPARRGRQAPNATAPAAPVAGGAASAATSGTSTLPGRAAAAPGLSGQADLSIEQQAIKAREDGERRIQARERKLNRSLQSICKGC